MNILSILWDYDGTLVDTTKKNMAVTLEVLKNFIPDVTTNMPEALTSIDNYKKANYKYKNWTDLYKNCYGLTENQVQEAGTLWSPYQLSNTTTPELFPGLKDVIENLNHINHGICSQNCSQNIFNTLKKFDVAQYFNSIIGYEDIGFNEQKPNPVPFIKCIDKLKIPLKDGVLIYIGDHQEDTIFARNAEKYYISNNNPIKIFTIAASYSGESTNSWNIKPDYVAYSTEDILSIINEINQL